ncbi:MAG: hypothetical protein KDB03_11345 [Planctomycetales bacterium]|nr:hypothetical protein [Planctomycetales bacterium]
MHGRALAIAAIALLVVSTSTYRGFYLLGMWGGIVLAVTSISTCHLLSIAIWRRLHWFERTVVYSAIFGLLGLILTLSIMPQGERQN